MPVGYLTLSFSVLQLLAVESIYGDNIVILENQGGLKYFQVVKQLIILAFAK